MKMELLMIQDFLKGALAMGFLVASGFFFRFWRETRDRLFVLFAVAFLLLAINRLQLFLLHEDREASLGPYVVRLLAFTIIATAIVDKNLRRN
jgi:hypothetical protein